MSVTAGITRAEAWDLLQEHVKNPNMLKHCLASEAVMRAAARRLGQDEEAWGLAGLLHDLDVELTGGDLKVHGLRAVEMLTARGVAPEIVDAIKMHNENAHGQKRSTVFQKALAASETITGLVTATTLVYPDQKLASVRPSSVVKRMKEKSFAASVDRDIIRECEAVGIPLPEFAELAVAAMRAIAVDLGL
ncbi:MAG: HDIG domain-containing protein [Elusimicrobia bacterium]|nr:HDIG domain-containing protein [Elusimicrobiota bacterium]